MISIIRALVVILLIESLVCGYFIIKALFLPVAILPQFELPDPLINQEFQNLAKLTESGESSDWMALGYAMLGQGLYPYAEICFQNASEADPKNLHAKVHKAFCLDRTGRTSEAIPLYSEVAEKVDGIKLEFCQYAAGCCLLREGKIDEAKDFFKQISDSTRADYQLGKLLIRQNRSKEAIPILKRALQSAPNSVHLTHQLALAYAEQGKTKLALKTEEAENCASYIVEKNYNTSFIEPHQKSYGIHRSIEKAAEFANSNDTENLGSELTKLSEVMKKHLSPDHQSILVELGDLAIQRKQPQTALLYINQLLKLNIYSADLFRLQGERYQLTGETNKMISAWKIALQLDSDIEIHQRLADYYKHQKNEILMKRQLAQISFIQGKQKYHKNKLKEAATLFLQSVTDDPQNQHAWFYHAEASRLSGNNVDAMVSYKRCLKLNPYNGRAIVQLERMKKK